MTLDQLPLGKNGTIREVNGTASFRRRLMELGMLPGTTVRRTGQAPLGDPITYLVRGAVFGLRRTEAALIDLEA